MKNEEIPVCEKHEEEKVARYRKEGGVRWICRSCAREYKRDRYGYIGKGFEQDRTPLGSYRGSRDKRIPDEVKELALKYMMGKL